MSQPPNPQSQQFHLRFDFLGCGGECPIRLTMLATPHLGPLVPLLLVTLCCAPTVLADGGNGAQMLDNCDIKNSSLWVCGDQCLDQFDSCFCGDNTTATLLHYELVPSQYCCTTSGCLRTAQQKFAGRPSSLVLCVGQVLDISKPCNNTCFADYWESQKVSAFRSHYTCDNQECLPLRDMCTGSSNCGESRTCSEEL